MIPDPIQRANRCSFDSLCEQIKPSDVIIRVGNMSVQNQSLVNLRELILGDPGSFVTLGFSRGGTSQFYEVSLMRGSPEYLDQQQQPSSKLISEGPAPSMPNTSSSSFSMPSRSENPARSEMSVSTSNASNSGGMYQSQGSRTEMSSRSDIPISTSTSTSTGGMYQSAGPTTGTSSRELDEIERLRAALSASQAEVARLRANLRSQVKSFTETCTTVFVFCVPICVLLARCELTSVICAQELLAERNGEELRTYREALERREDEQRQGQNKDDRHRQVRDPAQIPRTCVHECLFPCVYVLCVFHLRMHMCLCVCVCVCHSWTSSVR
jgi:hypothetical protein